MLDEAQLSSAPGIGFGECGAGFIRLTGFNSPENTRKAMERLAKANLNSSAAGEEDSVSLNDVKAIKALDDLQVLDEITKKMGI